MIDLYRYYIDKGPAALKDGVPDISENIPPAATEQLRKINLAVTVEFQQLSAGDLLHKTRGFFAIDRMDERAHLIDFTADKVTVFAAGAAGCFHAVQTLVGMLTEASCHNFVLAASPRGRSGIKLYLPSPTPEGFADFKRIIDFAAYCRCTFVMLELGGALEYKRHGEINSAWVKYCRTMNEYPGKTLDVQNNSPWRKNSIHSENGGGRFLTQAEFMSLVHYCRERFLEVIPEMPSLSHSDYILNAHPEFAERKEDLFPDACCPLNENYQQLYRELLDEVICLMHPERINIGHDELYSISLCPRCKDKDPAQLYADDINRTVSYLAGQGIKTVIWGEKLLDAHWQNGEPVGGAAIPADAGKEAVPALYPAREYLTESLEIMHWYWTVDRQLEQVYAENNFPYCFGNLNPVMFKDWEKRISAPLATGTCVSNWGQTNWRTLQRNGVLYDLFYTSQLMWNDQLGEDDFQELDKTVFDKLFRWCKETEKDGCKYLEVTHTVKSDIKFQYFFDGFLLDENSFYLGDHVFADSSGKEYRFKVIFGSNVSNDNVFPRRGDDPEGLRDAWVYNLQHTEVAGECLKEYDGKTVWYTCRYKLPDSAADLKYVMFAPAQEICAEVRVLKYAVKYYEK